MKLTDLEPQLTRIAGPDRYEDVTTLQNAQGLMFECPCGGHSVLVWFRDRGVPGSERPGPGRWQVSGSGYSDLTLSPSVHLTGAGCGWHGFVTNGEVTRV